MTDRRTEPELLEIAEQILTPKQLRVLRYWLAGHSPGKIALALDLHESTVRGHLNAAFRRLKPHARKEAA